MRAKASQNPLSYFGLAAQLTVLFLCVGAHAETSGNAPLPPPVANDHDAPPQAGVPLDGWENEKFERQQYREEMQQIRKEHEDLEMQGDALKAKCAGAKGTLAEECSRDLLALHERHRALHERMMALHAKMDAERQERAEHHMQNQARKMPPPPANGNTGSPAPPAQ